MTAYVARSHHRRNFQLLYGTRMLHRVRTEKYNIPSSIRTLLHENLLRNDDSERDRHR
jgi:hypothetical protein